jgi:hypothetical protein
MPDLTPPIEVSESTAGMDSSTALLRQVTLILGAVPTLLLFLGKKDFIGLLNWFQGTEGVAFAGAVALIVALVWGQIKTFRRGKQMVVAAEDPRNEAIRLKN